MSIKKEEILIKITIKDNAGLNLSYTLKNEGRLEIKGKDSKSFMEIEVKKI